jgi:hypothetical protein
MMGDATLSDRNLAQKLKLYKAVINESPGKSIPGTTKKNYNKVKGGNYHEYFNDHPYHRSVAFSVRRRRRLLL